MGGELGQVWRWLTWSFGRLGKQRPPGMALTLGPWLGHAGVPASFAGYTHNDLWHSGLRSMVASFCMWRIKCMKICWNEATSYCANYFTVWGIHRVLEPCCRTLSVPPDPKSDGSLELFAQILGPIHMYCIRTGEIGGWESVPLKCAPAIWPWFMLGWHYHWFHPFPCLQV